jgi:acyl transferase domain-containing protein
VNAFGFGGVNYHLALEEFRSADYQHATLLRATDQRVVTVPGTSVPERPQPDQQFRAFFLSATSREDLQHQVNALLQDMAANNDIHATAHKLSNTADASQTHRLAFTAGTPDRCLETLRIILKHLESGGPAEQLQLKGILYSEAPPVTAGQIAFLFPGQGSQYPDMLQDLRAPYASFENTFDRADHLWQKLTGTTISQLIGSDDRGKEATLELLRDTRNTHPALFVTEYAVFTALEEMGVAPYAMIGHSVGEIIALAASGALSFADGLRFSNLRVSARLPLIPRKSVWPTDAMIRSRPSHNTHIWPIRGRSAA